MIERSERLSQLLQDAILIAERSHQEAVLEHLCGARLSLRDVLDEVAPIRIDLLSGRVFARGLPMPLSPSELALVMALALNPRGVLREQLAEDLYPGAETASALNSIKVNAHRVRRRAGRTDAIHYDSGRYLLGEIVDVELYRLESELHRLRLVERLSGEERDRLEQLRQRALDGRPAFMLEWPWFDTTEQRVRDFGHDITAVLARDALRAGRYQRALELATELAAEDCLDEFAAHIAIRAYLLAGNRAAAILEYRRYASTLRREVDTSPSDDLRALLDDM